MFDGFCIVLLYYWFIVCQTVLTLFYFQQHICNGYGLMLTFFMRKADLSTAFISQIYFNKNTNRHIYLCQRELGYSVHVYLLSHVSTGSSDHAPDTPLQTTRVGPVTWRPNPLHDITTMVPGVTAYDESSMSSLEVVVMTGQSAHVQKARLWIGKGRIYRGLFQNHLRLDGLRQGDLAPW